MLDHHMPVNFKVKGLLKGLRYISQVFDGEKEEEEEMQIGLPTDVKHVAHIGWDGSSVSNPTWMNDFSQAGADEKESIISGSQEIISAIASSPSHESSMDSPKKHRRARRPASSEAVGTDDSSSRGTRHSRKNQSTGSAPGSSESSDGSRRGRRHSKPENSSKPESETHSPARDIPSVPKKTHKKRTTTTSKDGSGSACSSGRSKEEDSITRPLAVEKVA